MIKEIEVYFIDDRINTSHEIDCYFQISLFSYLGSTINRDSVLFLFHESICQLDQDGSQNNSKLIRVKSFLEYINVLCIITYVTQNMKNKNVYSTKKREPIFN